MWPKKIPTFALGSQGRGSKVSSRPWGLGLQDTKEHTKNSNFFLGGDKNGAFGIPVVAQWLMNPTSIHEDMVSIPGLAQWIEDPAVP